MREPALLPLLLTTLEATATIAFALSGLMEAARKRLDAVGGCIGAMLLLRGRHFAPTERAMQWPDAVGLGLFSAGGTQLALAQGLPAIVAVLMGVVTAVFGGVLRDIVCNEIPSAFRDHRPYAVCAFAGGWVLVGARSVGLDDSAAVLLAAATAFGLRALALATGYRLPAWTSGPER